jgi:hypothetical protein
MAGKKYKIEFARHGHQYDPKYCQSIAGAVKVAQSKGWYEHGKPGSDWDGRPYKACISERCGEVWELVATVNAEGIESEDCQSRRSYKRAEEKLADAKACMEAAYRTMAQLNNIANRSQVTA